MSWSYVSKTSGTAAASPIVPTWPAGLQDGDVLIMHAQRASDAVGADRPTCSTLGWTSGPANYVGRFFFARWSPALAQPSVVFGASVVCKWELIAWRAQRPVAFGNRAWVGNGASAPPVTPLTTVAPNTLVVTLANAIGDQAAYGGGWTVALPGASTVASVSAAGSGDPLAINYCIAWADVATPTALADIRTTWGTGQVQFYWFTAAEADGGLDFDFWGE